ncbi:MAG: hypothetical protein ACYC8S_03830 [Minisyncoccota bacterium]
MKKMFSGFVGGLFALCCLFVGASALASTVTLVNVNGSVVRNGVWEGFYTLTVNGNSVQGMCDDLNTHVDIGDTWTATVYNYSDVSGGAGKFASLSNAVTRYSQVGWLFSQASADPNHNADLQEAVWKIMGASPTMSSNANSLYSSAIGGSHDTYDWSGVMKVVTPNPFTVSQEYLIPAAVPVPPAVGLFLSGLMGIGFVARSSRTRRQSARV